VRKGTGELLTGIGLAATNDQGEADDPLLGVIGYVEPELAHEYELVMVAEAQLTGYLAQLPGESRLNAFRHILRHTRLRNSLKLPPLQDVALAIASGSVPSSSQSLPPQTGPVPEEVPTIEVEGKPVDEKLSAPQPVEAPAVVVEPPLPMKKEPITVVLFDFSRLRTEPDKFAHLRVIGGTGIGKTTFVDWLLDILGGSASSLRLRKSLGTGSD
jgi:hypothetical protein